MKKIITSAILCMIAIVSFFGCGSDVNGLDIKNAYQNMIASSVVEGRNIYFADSSTPNTVKIFYDTELLTAINNVNPISDDEKRYRALGYQQDILYSIFNFYETYSTEFYKNIDSKDVDNAKLEDLKKKLDNLNIVLTDFRQQYDIFMDNKKSSGLSDMMSSTINRYAYEVNGIIDVSFEFIYRFIDLYMDYCVEDIDKINADTLNINLQKAYVDIAYVVYLENIKALNDAVGDVGICDLAGVINLENEFCLLDEILDNKSLSETVSSNLNAGSPYYEKYISLVNDFLYTQDVFEQRLDTYIANMSKQDMYLINRYRFNMYSGFNYEDYLKSLSVSEKSSVDMLEYFVKNNFKNLIEKIKLIVM